MKYVLKYIKVVNPLTTVQVVCTQHLYAMFQTDLQKNTRPVKGAGIDVVYKQVSMYVNVDLYSSAVGIRA